MAIDWNKYGKKAFSALHENGISAVVSYEETGEYNINTGTSNTTVTEFETDVIIKNYETNIGSIINPEDVEIIFHSGELPDIMPDLLDKNNIKIICAKKAYSVINLKAVRPAGVTMLYKARAVESGTES